MSKSSPLLELHEQAGALLMPYGPAESPVFLVAAIEPVQIEYAVLRRGTGVFDQTHRGQLSVTGTDRMSFLNRMLTQELGATTRKGEPGFGMFAAAPSFWLNRKGRIDADMRVVQLPDRVLLDMDIFAADRARTTLDSYAITEDIAFSDVSTSVHRLGVHGPASAAMLASVSTHRAGTAVGDLTRGQVSVLSIDGAEVIAWRADIAGEIGIELSMPVDAAAGVYAALMRNSAKAIGWHALNIARIEAGTALYNVDFGPDSLPHECGPETLNSRVSFTKGCYLGQEIVARMQSLGHPKQRLVGLRCERSEAQAETGSAVLNEAGETIGAVTSSCESPLLGAAPIAIAMMKWSAAQEGTRVTVRVGDGSGQANLSATVQESLVFVKRG